MPGRKAAEIPPRQPSPESDCSGECAGKRLTADDLMPLIEDFARLAADLYVEGKLDDLTAKLRQRR